MTWIKDNAKALACLLLSRIFILSWWLMNKISPVFAQILIREMTGDLDRLLAEQRKNQAEHLARVFADQEKKQDGSPKPG